MPSGAPAGLVPAREALLQRQDQRIAERREAEDDQQHDADASTAAGAAKRVAISSAPSTAEA